MTVIKNRTIVPELKIGSSCFFMNLSAIFEYHNMLSAALIYTIFDFIYHPEHITGFINPKPPKDYISPENDLFIIGGIDSIYTEDYSEYQVQSNQDFNIISLKTLDLDVTKDLAKGELEYLDKDQPIIFRCDHYYMYEDYKKLTNDIMHYHTDSHSTVLVDMDLEKKECMVIDKFFSFAGPVSLQSYINANTSEHIKGSEGHFMKIEILDFVDMDERDRARFFLKHNLERVFLDSVMIDGRQYYKNIRGLEMLIKDLPDVLQTMHQLKGKYAPQFTTNLFQPIMLDRLSFRNMIKYLSGVLDNPDIKELLPLLDEVKKLWFAIDKLCDKCYLKGEIITNYTDRFTEIFQQIAGVEVQIYKKLHSVYTGLPDVEYG